MKSGRIENVIAITFAGAVLSGCSAMASIDPTHEWTASHKKLALTFRHNNSYCADTASSVDVYESCMQDKGYKLISQR